jgi:outer membrane usher protein
MPILQNRIIVFLFICFYSFISSASLKPLSYTKRQFKEYFLTMVVNGTEKKDISVFLKDDKNRIFMKEIELYKIGFLKNLCNVFYFEGENYCNLSLIKDIKYKLNEEELKIYLHIPVNYFKTNEIDLAHEKKQLDMPPYNVHKGLFLNYDFTAEYLKKINATRIYGLNELGLYYENGFIATSTISQWEKGKSNSKNYRVKRLESYWIVDFPEKMKRLRLGDSISYSPVWGGNSFFAGLQYATNFATQPNFITFPLPKITGQVYKPTSYDIYVNNNFKIKKELSSGPFELTNLPIVTGSGEIGFYTQSKTGKVQLFAIPYYASSLMLKTGLDDFSFETGFERKNFGRKDFSYDRPIASGTYRYGFNDFWTFGTHSELTRKSQNLGFLSDIQIGNFGIFSTAISGSYGIIKSKYARKKHHFHMIRKHPLKKHSQKGHLAFVGFQRQAEKLSFSVNSTFSSKHFWRLGMSNNYFLPKIKNEVFVGYAPGFLGQFTLCYTDYIHNKNKFNRNKRNEYLTIGFNTNLSPNLYFALSGTIDLKKKSNYGIYMTLSMPIGKDHNINTNVSLTKKSLHESVHLSKQLPIDTGLGYNFTTSQKQNTHHKNNKHRFKNNNSYYAGNIAYRSFFGTHDIRAIHHHNRDIFFAHTNGSISFIENKFYVGQYLNDSFGVVEVPGYKDVKIYRNNQFMGKTDRNGMLYINQLIPFQRNIFKIDSKDLPMSAEINDIEKEAVPSFRSGINVKFNIKEATNVSLMIVNEKGQKPSIGTEITFQNKLFLIGYDGKAYLTDININDKGDGTVLWNSNKCYFRLNLDRLKAEDDIGKVMCKMKTK